MEAVLREAFACAEKGLVDADLGGGVIKQRIARQVREPRHSSCTGSLKSSARTSMTKEGAVHRSREAWVDVDGEATRGAVEEGVILWR